MQPIYIARRLRITDPDYGSGLQIRITDPDNVSGLRIRITDPDYGSVSLDYDIRPICLQKLMHFSTDRVYFICRSKLAINQSQPPYMDGIIKKAI